MFANAPRIDSVFVEGLPLHLLQAAVAAARQYHPNVGGWHSPCGDNRTDWYSELADPSTHQWLQGVVWGPITLGGEVQELQKIKSLGYDVRLFRSCSACACIKSSGSACFCASNAVQVRLYPDVSHTLTAMYPVPDWHFAWAFTHGRQVCH